MATPHVTGVLAALFHKNNTLTSNEARDVVLDPASYDTLSDAKAKNTSTGGRLNFAKALARTPPAPDHPTLNNFPVLTMGSNVSASGGSQVNLAASPFGASDTDPLRMAWAAAASRQSQWLFGWMLNLVFPSTNTFTAPSLVRTATVPYDVSVADSRGGSASGRKYLTVLPVLSESPPSGTLAVSPTDAPIGSTITASFPVKTSKKGQAGWELWIGQQYGASGTCCFTGTSATFTLSTAGVYRISTQAIDQQLNLSPIFPVSARQSASAVVRIGGATGEPPIASATLDKGSGQVPLTVNVDLSTSHDPDGSIKNYYIGCGDGTLTGSKGPNLSCTFTNPGPYWIILMVQDNSGYSDVISAYVVATPAL
jgi:hypothetical protein